MAPEPEPEPEPEEEPRQPEQPRARSLKEADDQFRSRRSSLALPSVPDLPHASWFRQFRVVLWKNTIQLSRRPFSLFLLFFSSILSVLLAWASGKDPDYEMYPLPPLTDCNTVPQDFLSNSTRLREIYGDSYSSDMPTTLNESWRRGLPTSVMACGPLLSSICVFLIVHGEMTSRMLGVLRSLGLRDSAYWSAWFVPFASAAFVNSLLGAAVASGLPVHVFRVTYYGGIFASLFFLQIALIPASFFLAALCGSSREGAPWLILVMLLCPFVPYMCVTIGSPWTYASSNVVVESPIGMYWAYQNTTQYRYDTFDPTTGESIYSECQRPVLSESYGTKSKTREDQRDPPIAKDDYFVGCYQTSSYFSMAYDNPKGVGPLVPLFMIPYWHFSALWGNILGYTAIPGHAFDASRSSLSTEELAIAALPVPPDPSRGNGTTLYPQGSTLNVGKDFEQVTYYDPRAGYSYRGDNCPAYPFDADPSDTRGSDRFCSSMYDCEYGAEPSPTKNTPSVNASIGYLALLSAIYALLASYWAQVFPCGNGAGQRWYFFLTRSYWSGSSSSDPEEESGGTGGVDDNGRRSSVAAGGGVVVKDVRKRFGSFEAVRGVSLQMGRGEVTALLGHNGAGKTTLSNILTCELRPTSGDIYVFGKSVQNDQYAVRSMVGVCRQDDYLWDDMSAREHLEIFGGLRGIDPEVLPGVVQRWLESVDLAEVQLGYSSSFSGGMKRRLSVALATIGDRPLIVLDEPTTGMDPVSRRFVWRHIDEIKDDRVVLLTTHAMEEADLLADAVAIMRKGDLAASGSPLQLKADHGSALQFNLLVDKTHVREIERTINDRFEGGGRVMPGMVTVVAGEAGNITVNIQKIRQEGASEAKGEGGEGSEGEGSEGVSVADLTDFVAWLDDPDSGVAEYGFSNSSLEEVFLKVTKGDKKDDEDDDNDDDELDVDVCCPCCCKGCISCCLKGCCGKGCCRPKPRIKEIADEEGGGTGTDNEGSDGDVVAGSKAAVNASISTATFTPNLTVMSQNRALLIFTFKRHWTGKSSIANYVMFSILVVVAVIIGLATDPRYDLYGLFVIPVAFLSFMMMSIVGPIYTDRAEGLFYISRTQGMLARSYVLATSLYSFLVQFAYAFLLLTLYYASPMFREPYICPGQTGSNYDYNYCQQYWGEPAQYTNTSNPINFFNGEHPVHAVPMAGSYGMVFGTIALFALSMPGAVLSSSYVPGKVLALVVLTFVMLLASIAPLWFYSSYGTTEQQTLECAELLSMPLPDPQDPYSCSTPCCDQSFNLTNLGTEFLDCVGADVSSSNGRALCIPSVVSIMSQFGGFQTLSLTTQAKLKFWSSNQTYLETEVIPSIERGGGSCKGNICKFPLANELYGQNMGFWVLGCFLTVILGIALAYFFAFPTGMVLRFKTTVSHFFENLRCRRRSKTNNKKGDDDGASPAEPELGEVAEERRAVGELVRPLLSKPGPDALEAGHAEQDGAIVVDHGGIPRDDVSPVLMYKLRKVYPSLGGRPPKEALKSLSLHVPRGQVLGLLGKNGAGKTTALKILSAAHESSGGLALVAGYDVSCERISVFERLGNCAQFDVIWKHQSIQLHLEFFARLKGMPNDRVQEAAHSIATAVGLGAPEVYARHAGQLSGGMRRRLSIAISLIGAPSVLLLDEPSTGLDPSTRNSIWALVNSFATPERAIIITTHMMIEADTLCQRIAIVSQGELKVVATQQHLKNEYGSGYLLQLNLVRSSAAAQESAMSFVKRRLHKDAVLGIKQAKTLHIQLPRDLDLQRVFSVLYSPEATTEGCINQFLLSQSSLEDVFIALGD
mmetsp:Transcript_57713/g.172210  ORF Transcript_57713/g.172210 Transcript_57713/m.172210 type:complete len:1811 (-) Transcript_57713:232-5664(-)